MDDEFVELPANAGVGDQAVGTSTRFFLELTSGGAPDDWYRTGVNMEAGHPTEADAEAEWNGFDELERTDYYTAHRIVRASTTVTLTVLQKA